MLEDRLRPALTVLRVALFVFMAVWVADKFINPAHTAAVFSKFYAIDGVGPTVSYMLGAAQGILLIGFLFGYAKTVTYGAMLVLHAASTLVSFPRYLAPFDGANLLFYAAWPTLAAFVVLFLLRDHDTMLTAGGSRS